jgi:hypothetical protein
MRKLDESRPKTQESYEESLFDVDAGHPSPGKKEDIPQPRYQSQHNVASKFHELIDDGPVSPVEKKKDSAEEEQRSSAVAEAVETPISP